MRFVTLQIDHSKVEYGLPQCPNVVLVVDDEQAVVRTATMALASAGFKAVVAENGAAGIEAYLGMKDEICLVIADFLMPIMDGQKMAETIRQIDPRAKILLMSGYSDSVLKLSGEHDFPFIRKPFLPADLIRAVKGILAAGATA